MQRPWYQTLATGVMIVLGGFLLLGTVLDAVGNAITLIPPFVTYGGTIIIVAVTAGLYLLLKKRPLTWVVHGGRAIRVTRLGRRPLLALLGATLLLWVPRVARTNDRETGAADDDRARDSLPVYQGRGVEAEGAHFRMWPARMIDGMIEGKSGRDGRYSSNAADFARGLSATPGDEIIVSIYFLNPSATNYSTAHNTRLVSRFETGYATEHEVAAAIGIDNGMTVYSRQAEMGGVLRVRTSVPTKLVYVRGSTHMCLSRQPLAVRKPPTLNDPTGACADAEKDSSIRYVRLPDGIANEVVYIGDLPGLYSGIVVFALSVEAEDQN